jgi:hypothetical protein
MLWCTGKPTAQIIAAWLKQFVKNRLGIEKPRKLSVLQQTTLEDIIIDLITLYQQLGWVYEVTENDIDMLIKEAKATENRIIEAGLNPKPHGVYRIGIIPANFNALRPYKMRKILRKLHRLEPENHYWGLVNPYYRKWGKSEIWDNFTETDTGKVFFLVEDKDAPGYNANMPGSLLANMDWGDARDSAFANWKQKFKAAGTIHALNYATHGLIWLGEVKNWDKALGRIGHYDYIEQPVDIKRGLYPCGCIHTDEAMFGVTTDAAAHPNRTIAAVVW